jgi:bis(5'-nucleosyl)-tetraphosphatase (symmetrical)
MKTWIIGDLHGCMDSLSALLERLDYARSADRLWLVGDLVNRGPANLEVLRWCMAEQERVTVVLGNHDLHLLAVAAGAVKQGRSDTLGDVLGAPDRDLLLDWLRRRPLLHRAQGVTMVHAGVPMRWSLGDAEERAREAEAALAGDGWAAFVAGWRSRQPAETAQVARDYETLDHLTRMRTVDGDGRMVKGYTGPPAEAGEGTFPWFDTPDAAEREPIYFGHWARLGLFRGKGVCCLDAGCVYGNGVAALGLEDETLIVQPSVEPRLLDDDDT